MIRNVFLALSLAAGALAQPVSHSHLHRRVIQLLERHQSSNGTVPWHMDYVGEQAPGSCAVGSVNNQDGNGNGVDQYIQYTGDGTTQQGWPDKSSEFVFRRPSTSIADIFAL